jgi:hypothetical protein
MSTQLPTGLTPDESSFQPIGNSGGSPDSNSAPPSLTGDESTFQPLSGTSSPSSPSSGGSFQTPNGNSYTPGQSVQHSSGVHGEVTGQNSQTGNAEVKWHQGAENFKPGTMVTINGEPSTIVGKTNNGKVIVEGKWGRFGGVHSVSPSDIDAPSKVTSALSGFANSFLGSATGAAHIVGAHPQGLENAQQNAADAQAANPASGKAGELAADLVQFLGANGIVKAGTGAIAAIPAVEQYAQAAKITKALADHPILARILHAGINGAAAQGGVSAVQSGGNPTATAEGAAAGGLADVGGEFAPDILAAGKAGLQKVGGAISKAGEAGADFVKSVPDLPGKLWPDKIEVPSSVDQAKAKIQSRIDSQPVYDQHASDIRKAFVNGLKDKGIDLNIPNDVDVRKIPDLANKALENEYKPLYGKIDEALESEGYTQKYQDAEDDIKNLAQESKAEKDPDKAAAIAVKLRDAKEDLATMNSILKDKGLDGAVQRATDLRKQAYAIDEVKTKILSHTQDLNGTLPRTDPNGFNKALNNLKFKKRYNGNRLYQAFGENNGEQLIADTRAAQKSTADLANAERLRVAGVQDLQKQATAVNHQRKVTRNVGLYLGAPVGLGVGADIVRHVVE